MGSASSCETEFEGPAHARCRHAGRKTPALHLANDCKYGLSAYLFSNDAKAVQRFIEGCDFGELYINKIGPEQLNGYHTGYRLSGLLGDDGTHGLEKYSRRRTAYTSWRDDTAADLMPFAA